MKTCPSCGELVGDTVKTCFKCHYTFPSTAVPSAPEYKVCPKCKKLYKSSVESCEACHIPLAAYSSPDVGYKSEKWPYILGFLFPAIGIVLGLIYISQKEDKGPSVLGVSVVGGIIWGIVIALLL